MHTRSNTHVQTQYCVLHTYHQSLFFFLPNKHQLPLPCLYEPVHTFLLFSIIISLRTVVKILMCQIPLKKSSYVQKENVTLFIS